MEERLGAQATSEIRDAVRLALIEDRLIDHEKRIEALERFKWWLLTALAVTGFSSTGSLMLLLLEKVGR